MSRIKLKAWNKPYKMQCVSLLQLHKTNPLLLFQKKNNGRLFWTQLVWEHTDSQRQQGLRCWKIQRFTVNALIFFICEESSVIHGFYLHVYGLLSLVLWVRKYIYLHTQKRKEMVWLLWLCPNGDKTNTQETCTAFWKLLFHVVFIEQIF